MSEEKSTSFEVLPNGYESIARELAEIDTDEEIPEEFCLSWRAAVEKEAMQMKKEKKFHGFGRTGIRVAAAAAAVVFVVGGTLMLQKSAPNQMSGRAYYEEGRFAYEDSTPMLMAESAEMEFTATTNRASAQETQRRNIILRTADLSINTTRYDEDMTSVGSLLKQTGGWSEYESTSGEAVPPYGSGNGRRTSMTLRVPADSLDSFLEQLSAIGTVTSSSVRAEDVSASYYDTAGRLAIYEAQRERLTQLLGQAETMSDILEIEDSLMELQYDIESLQGTLNRWDSYADMAVVNLSVREIAVAQAKQEVGYFARLADAFKTSVEEAVVFFGDMVVFLVSALPYLVVIGAVALCVAGGIRRAKHRKQAKESEERS